MSRALALLALLSLSWLALAAPPEGMILIPAGPFRMGAEMVADEKPVHSVTVAAVEFAVHEVTNGEYAKFIDAKGYANEKLWSKDGWAWREKSEVVAPRDWENRRTELGEAFARHPVVGVCYHEAEAYARFAGARLPTEVEWEKAARGALERTYPWGEDAAAGGAAGDAATRTYPVGSNPKDKSPYGIMDMGGNVAEWTSSWFLPYPGSEHESSNHGQKYRVIRGGSWRFDIPTKRRCAWRGYWRNGKPEERGPYVGIRLVRDADSTD